MSVYYWQENRWDDKGIHLHLSNYLDAGVAIHHTI